MQKRITDFLKTKGFRRNEDTMILEFSKKSGVVVSCYDDDNDEEKYEFTLNYLSDSGDPQLIFCGLTGTKLIDKFDLMYQLAYNLNDFLVNHRF